MLSLWPSRVWGAVETEPFALPAEPLSIPWPQRARQPSPLPLLWGGGG